MFHSIIPMRLTFSLRSFFLAAMLAAGAVHAQEALRPDVGKPLKAAEDMIRAGKFKEALAKIREAGRGRRQDGQ